MINLTEGELTPINKQKNTSLKGKEVSIKKIDGTLIEGFVKETNENELILAKNGNWEDKVILSIDEIEVLDSSEFPYYSESYKRRLREMKKPSFEYRFTELQLKELVGKYVSLNYDGKLLEGKISEVLYSKKGNAITINCLDGEVKTIEDYRIRDMEITGSNYYEHKILERLITLEEELTIMLEKYNEGCPEGPECRVQDPEILIEKYFESRMKGLNMNFDYNWCHEIMDKRDEYKNSEKSFLDDFRKAKELNTYYECRKKFVDDSIKKIKHIDWTSYSKNQEEGIKQATKYIYESGIAVMLIDK